MRVLQPPLIYASISKSVSYIMRFFIISISLFLVVIHTAIAQIPCEDGFANGYPCYNVDLMSHVAPEALEAEFFNGIYVNDIWGWTDPDTGREYALVGLTNGTSFVDVTDAANPVVIGRLPDHEEATANSRLGPNGVEHDGVHNKAKSLWGDVKTYQHYAFIVSEDPAGGMQVFDLHQLRTLPESPLVFNESSHYAQIGNAHNIVINETTGFAYAVGATTSQQCSAGGLHIINIQDPLNPTYAGCFDDDGYTHDAQSVIYQGPDAEYVGREIIFNSNENSITFVDVTDKSNISLISRTPYDGSAYTHQGWLTEDHKYFISNDELDELNGLVDVTTSFVWDVSDLDEPVLVNRYAHPRATIDHNLYMHEDVVYQSNYTSGLIMLDAENISNDGQLNELAYFDTYPDTDAIDFIGTWSNYPFFKSGHVIVSDMTGGLFVLRPRLAVRFVVQPQDVTACAGEQSSFSVSASGDVEAYQWEIDLGSGFVAVESDLFVSGTQSSDMILSEIDEPLDGASFRCKISTYSQEVYFSAIATLEVQQEPEASFDYLLEGTRLTLANQSVNDEKFYWDFGDGTPFDSINSVTIHRYPSESNTYDVSLRVMNECGEDLLIENISVVVLGILTDEVFIYPNPAKGYMKVDVPDNFELVRMRVLDLQGKVRAESSTVELDLKNLDAGIYLVKLLSAKAD
ncbi:MAG: choice-of-anchor B domain-containing protein, partial [Cyclobacteriaceae bacterium]